ncbi:hypothetical protein ATANTOWER_023907, partial [Ataeniobius toweri]|nr:hypothetical protein [Ataeniobius toweri]
CTGLQSSMASVNKTVRLRLMGLDCFLPMESWCILSLTNRRCGSLIQMLQQCCLIKTRPTSLSTLFLRVFQMPRRNS